MIGFYDYTVVVSYLSIVSAVVGMIEVFNGNFTVGIICLAFCGLCDGLDGKIARTKKDRTKDEKEFGIQLDSLCDVVCFGAFPVMLAYNLGMNRIIGVIILCFYMVCSVIRLAYFNVMEERRQTEHPESQKIFHGVPITTISVGLPLAYVVGILTSPMVFYIILNCTMLVFALAFIIDIKIPKPKTLLVLCFCVIFIIFLIIILVLIQKGIIIPQKIGNFEGFGRVI